MQWRPACGGVAGAAGAALLKHNAPARGIAKALATAHRIYCEATSCPSAAVILVAAETADEQQLDATHVEALLVRVLLCGLLVRVLFYGLLLARVLLCGSLERVLLCLGWSELAFRYRSVLG